MEMCVVLFGSLVTEPSEISEHSCDLLRIRASKSLIFMPSESVFRIIRTPAVVIYTNEVPYITFLDT
jgi:hypothetical protein